MDRTKLCPPLSRPCYKVKEEDAAAIKTFQQTKGLMFLY